MSLSSTPLLSILLFLRIWRKSVRRCESFYFYNQWISEKGMLVLLGRGLKYNLYELSLVWYMLYYSGWSCISAGTTEVSLPYHWLARSVTCLGCVFIKHPPMPDKKSNRACIMITNNLLLFFFTHSKTNWEFVQKSYFFSEMYIYAHICCG